MIETPFQNTYVHDLKRRTYMVPTRTRTKELLALPRNFKKVVVESPNSELTGEVPLGSSRRKNFSK